ncbi:Protein of unknown function [Pyronema omphalodes CBS 100304]|uniref:Uncharacterized protein n=1 Tax=Pyronema omphalodes (strain CBS 100304) TaxID=1076935 RepID=U4LR01_PYROM|nr:Protein of unknown function [Pyronema omphalodes CBS 100304]
MLNCTCDLSLNTLPMMARSAICFLNVVNRQREVGWLGYNTRTDSVIRLRRVSVSNWAVSTHCKPSLGSHTTTNQKYTADQNPQRNQCDSSAI